MDDKIKVTFVSNTYCSSEARDRWLKHIVETLQSDRVEPRVILFSSSNQPSLIVDTLKLRGIDCTVLPLQKYGESDVINILQELKRNPPDIFVPNLSLAAHFAVKWLKKAGIASIGMIRDDNRFYYELIDHFIDGLDQFKVDAVICSSQYLYNKVIDRIDEGQEIVQCPPGVILDDIYAKAPKEKIKIVSIAKVELEQEKVLQQIKELPMEMEVSYVGALDEFDMYPTLAQNHIFVLFSGDEEATAVLLEAMACGVVPVCLNMKSKTEIVEDGINGLLVDDRDDSFYNAIERLKNEEGLWKRLSKAAIKTVESNYSTAVEAQKWSRLIKRLYNKNRKNIIEIPQLAYMNLPTVRANKMGMYRDFKSILHDSTYRYIRDRLRKIDRDKVVVLYGAGQFAVKQIKLYASLKPKIKFAVESFDIKNVDTFKQYGIEVIDLESFKNYVEKNFSNELVVFIVTVEHESTYQSIYEYIQQECRSFENEVIWPFKKPDDKVKKVDNFIDIELSKSNMDIYHARKSIKLFLDENINKYRGLFLDFGCGRMPYREYIIQNSTIEKYIGLDIENQIYQKESKPDIFWDGKRIPLDDGSIDTVMATEVFEHISDIESALSEIYRVLKPGGVLYFTVPYLWPLHDVPHDEYRYTPFSLQRHLKSVGFSNIVIKPTGGWNAALAQMLGLWIAQLKDPEEKAYRRGEFFSFYKTLLKSDKSDSAFENNMMITGLSGIVQKKESH